MLEIFQTTSMTLKFFFLVDILVSIAILIGTKV